MAGFNFSASGREDVDVRTLGNGEGIKRPVCSILGHLVARCKMNNPSAADVKHSEGPFLQPLWVCLLSCYNMLQERQTCTIPENLYF